MLFYKTAHQIAIVFLGSVLSDKLKLHVLLFTLSDKPSAWAAQALKKEINKNSDMTVNPDQNECEGKK